MKQQQQQQMLKKEIHCFLLSLFLYCYSAVPLTWRAGQEEEDGDEGQEEQTPGEVDCEPDCEPS